VPDVIEVLVADISFNSLSRLLPPVVPLLGPDCCALLLVKPQFELDPGQVEEGGVVRDPALHKIACERVRTAVETLGWTVDGLVESSIRGATGNTEFVLKAVVGTV
jgi:23S rRNA (cytidine1920-2'-O)/16S rRNA (cytidine1409-2'-O)-methyltransferase